MNRSLCRDEIEWIFHRLFWYYRTIKCLIWKKKKYPYPSSWSFSKPGKWAGTNQQPSLTSNWLYFPSSQALCSPPLSLHPIPLLSNWSEATLFQIPAVEQLRAPGLQAFLSREAMSLWPLSCPCLAAPRLVSLCYLSRCWLQTSILKSRTRNCLVKWVFVTLKNWSFIRVLAL